MAGESSKVNLGAEISRHDAEIEGLGRSIAGVERKVDQGFTDLYAKLSEIGRAVSGIGRTDTKTIVTVLTAVIAGFGLTVTLVSIVGSMALAPIVDKIKTLDTQIVRVDARTDSNRTLILQSSEVLRGIASEHERQINTVERVHIAELRGTHAAINASLAARNIPLIPFADLLEPMQAAPIPTLLSGSNGNGH